MDEQAPTDAADGAASCEKGARPTAANAHGLLGRLLSWTVPGAGQLQGREPTKGLVYLGLAVLTVLIALVQNRGWLYLFWRFKEQNLTSVFLQDYYAAKQHALYLFTALYLILLLASRIDARLNRSDPPEPSV